MSPEPQKFAVFDIDGTLFRWQLFHELVEELTLQKIFPETTYREVDDAWQQWRGGVITFHSYEQVIIKTLHDYLPSLSITNYLAACKAVVDRSGHKTHYFTRNLLNELQEQGYVTIALSGSQQELLEIFAKKYKITHCLGVIYEQKDGRFTGNTIRSTYGRKGEVLDNFVRDNNLTYTGSVAVGDSESDIAMLGLVEKPIAFNPSEELFNEAGKRNWPVVVERKNIVYKLEPSDGRYVLAEARPY